MAKLCKQKSGKVAQSRNDSKSKQHHMESNSCVDHNLMKPISKTKSNYLTFCRVCGMLIFMTIAYLFKKCYNIHNHSWIDEVDQVCYLGLFSCRGESTVELSITDRQFYIILYNSVFEDLSVTYQFVDNFVRNSSNPIDVDTSTLITRISVTICFLCAFMWFVYSWKLEKRRKIGRITSLTRDSRDISLCNGCEQSSDTCLKSQRSLWRWLPCLTFLAFLISIPWEFVRLYQFRVAEKITHVSKGIPEECVWNKMTYLQYLKSWMRWHFSWSSDACFQYHTALHVDPVWQVTPLLVLTSVISNCIVYPLETLCGGLGRAFRLFFSEIPSQWQPVMLAVLVIVLMMIIVMLFGYKIHFPFLKLEPKTQTKVKVKCHVRKQLETRALEDSFELDSSQEFIT